MLARPSGGDESVAAWFASLWIYKGLGVRAAESRLVLDDDGTVWIAVFVPDGWVQATEESLSKFKPELAEEMPADAWLANWSVFGPKSGM